jgi:hypothetical protein
MAAYTKLTDSVTIMDQEKYMKELVTNMGTDLAPPDTAPTINEAGKWNFIRWMRNKTAEHVFDTKNNALLKHPAGTLLTTDQGLQKPAEKCEEVKNEVEAPFGLGPVVLPEISKPKLNLEPPHAPPAAPEMDPKLQIDPDGKMVMANPPKEMNRMDISPRKIVQPEHVILRKGGSKRELSMFKEHFA